MRKPLDADTLQGRMPSDIISKTFRDIRKGALDTVIIKEESDLPSPTGGIHQLEDMTVYEFHGQIESDDSMELGDVTPIIGRHREMDWFIHTGGGTAIIGNGVDVLQSDIGVNAPGGTIYDIDGQADSELLVDTSYIADDQQQGSISDLGTIGDFRGPEFNRVGIRDFESGILFDGETGRILIDACKVRDVPTANVTAFQFSSNVSTDAVSINNLYVRDVLASTEVVRVDNGAVFDSIFQYRGNTHDDTVDVSNILTGEAGREVVGYRVTDSFPLDDSRAFADYSLDSQSTVNITQQAADKEDADAYVVVPGSTTENGSERFNVGDNSAEYLAERRRAIELNAFLSVGAGTTDTVAAAWFINGSIVPGTPTRIQLNQQGGGVAKTLVTSGVDAQMTNGDTFDVRVANLGSTTDVNVGELNAKLSD